MATRHENRWNYNAGAHHKLLRITAPHFVAGIEPHWRSAPIINYMLGWSESGIRKYCSTRNWTVEEIP